MVQLRLHRFGQTCDLGCIDLVKLRLHRFGLTVSRRLSFLSAYCRCFFCVQKLEPLSRKPGTTRGAACALRYIFECLSKSSVTVCDSAHATFIPIHPSTCRACWRKPDHPSTRMTRLGWLEYDWAGPSEYLSHPKIDNGLDRTILLIPSLFQPQILTRNIYIYIYIYIYINT